MNPRGFLALLEKGQGGGDAVATAGRADEDKMTFILAFLNIFKQV